MSYEYGLGKIERILPLVTQGPVPARAIDSTGVWRSRKELCVEDCD